MTKRGYRRKRQVKPKNENKSKRTPKQHHKNKTKTGPEIKTDNEHTTYQKTLTEKSPNTIEEIVKEEFDRYETAVEGNKFPLTVENILLPVLFDTGASVSCVSVEFYEKLPYPPEKYESDTVLTTADGKEIKTHGMCKMKFKCGDTFYNWPFTICENLGSHVILGLDFIKSQEVSFFPNKEGFNVLHQRRNKKMITLVT